MPDNTFIDGLGERADVPIGCDTRIRFQMSRDRSQDITVHMEQGFLVIYGPSRTLVIEPEAANRLMVRTKKWSNGR